VWTLIAQEATGSDPVEWVQYGVLGLVVFGLLTGWLWARPAVDRIIRENDALRRRVDAYEDEILGRLSELRDEIRELRRERPSS
jgi:hypothetical protein